MGTACGWGDEVPFSVWVQSEVDTSWGEGVHYVVNDEDAAHVWQHTYASLGDACGELGRSPLQVECLTIDDDSCGVAEVDGICCWASDVLDSPVVKGSVYLNFRADGSCLIREGHCLAKDGSSTHVDYQLPDAGP